MRSRSAHAGGRARARRAGATAAALVALAVQHGAAGAQPEAPPESGGAPYATPIGALVDGEQRIRCAGTLLSSDAVLTAAHCVAQDGVVEWPWGFVVGEDVSLGGAFVRVIDGAIHPDYDPFLHAADLAVLRVAGGEPRPWFLVAASDVPPIGTAMSAVGFGNGAVRADTRDVEVTDLTGDGFRYEPGTCPGDSGGPLLTAGLVPMVAGVVSTGAAACSSARAVAVAAHGDWIADAVQSLDPLACRTGDGECGGDCAVGDGDCECVEGDGACRLCAGADPDCSPSCEADGSCATTCLAPDPDCRTTAEGSACERDVECASALCFEATCRAPCEVATGAGCPPWAACVPLDPAGDDAEAGVCLPYEDAALVGGCAAGRAGRPRSHDVSAVALALVAALALFTRRTNSKGERP